MVDQDIPEGADRRTVLKTIGGAAVGTALAGCSGDGSGDSSDGGSGNGSGGGDGGSGGGDLASEFTMATPGEDTTAYAMASGISPVVQASTPMQMHVRPTAGSTQGMIQMIEGEVGLSEGTDLAALDALNEEGDFSDIEHNQQFGSIHSWYWIYFGFLVPTDSDFQYVSDLAGEPITIGPTGPSFHQYVADALKLAIPEEDLNQKFTPFSDFGSAMDAGEIVMAPFFNIGNIVPSYIEQILAQNEVRMLGWREENVQKFRDSSRLSGVYYSNDEDVYSDVDGFTGDGETFQVASIKHWWGSDKLSDDTVYELLSTIKENREQLTEVHPIFELWQDMEFWPQDFREDIPVHPGAAQFYKDEGLWDDSLTVADF